MQTHSFDPLLTLATIVGVAILIRVVAYGVVFFLSITRKLKAQVSEKMRKRGEKYLLEAKYDLALEEFRTAIDINPDDSLIYFFIATVNDRRGEYDSAIKFYKEFIDKTPNNTLSAELHAANQRLDQLGH
jgi:tetratricopeptide (TPR) repeat protein